MTIEIFYFAHFHLSIVERLYLEYLYFLAGLEPFTVMQSRGGYNIVDQKGFNYSFRGINKDGTRTWRCSKRNTYKCNAYVRTQAEENYIILHYNEHNHPSTFDQDH